MNTRDIDRFVRGACRGVFQGVYSIDTLPETPRLLVCNTDPSYKPGQHWVALYVDSRRRGEYFDSFGRKPPAIIEHYMNNIASIGYLTPNNCRVQSVTTAAFTAVSIACLDVEVSI
jgi:hypothetical protein